MKQAIAVLVVLLCAIGWVITYDIGRVWFPADETGNPSQAYWYTYDVINSAIAFLFCVSSMIKKPLTIKWAVVYGWLSVYMLLVFIGNVFDVNQKGNWAANASAVTFLFLIAFLLLPRSWMDKFYKYYAP